VSRCVKFITIIESGNTSNITKALKKEQGSLRALITAKSVILIDAVRKIPRFLKMCL
jgi:hypothetical protein